MNNILKLAVVLMALASLCRPALADDRERGEKFQLGADAGTLNVFAGKTDADFDFASGAPKIASGDAITPSGSIVTIEEVFRTPDGDGWYLVDVSGSAHVHGFVRAQELNALSVAQTLPREAELDWWKKVSPREIAAEKKAALAEESRIDTKAYDEQQTHKLAAAHATPRSAEMVVGNVCVLGMGKKLTPFRSRPSAASPVQFFMRDGTLAALKPDTDPLWRLVDAYINDGSVAEGYVAKWALGSCFMKMGPLYITDNPNMLLAQ